MKLSSGTTFRDRRSPSWTEQEMLHDCLRRILAFGNESQVRSVTSILGFLASHIERSRETLMRETGERRRR